MTLERDAIELLASLAITAGATAENVPSPCISVCRMDAQRAYCEGCLRSIDEIRAWSGSSDAQKKVIWAHIAQRASALAHSPTNSSGA